jgi:LysM repeat protein
MRVRILVALLAVTMLTVPSAASAFFAHTVARGESLSSVAAADGLSVDQLASANGLSSAAQLVAGSTLNIPSQGGGVSQASATPTVAVLTTPSSSSGGFSHVVAPGESLSSIAAADGLSVDQLAAANALSSSAQLLAGSTLTIPSQASGSTAGTVGDGDADSDDAGASDGSAVSGSAVPVSTSAASSQPVGSVAEGSPTNPPYPTPERVSASQVGEIASANGVSPSLAAAVAWQESGFNNDLVSSADARGVMQILPGTWDWIQRTLTSGTALAPASATDNVRGGVLLLHSLLSATGGDPALAAAGYFQGLPSVQRNGVLPQTQQYVNSVLALRQRFGGP